MGMCFYLNSSSTLTKKPRGIIMEQYNLKTDLQGITVKETTNTRISKHAKLVKCSFCDTTNSLKPFKHSYICQDCISYLKDFTTL